MTRSLRIEYEGAWYHVMNRDRGRGTIVPEERAYEAFLQTVAEACERLRLEVHGQCLMPNHYHRLIRTRFGGIQDPTVAQNIRCLKTSVADPEVLEGARQAVVSRFDP